MKLHALGEFIALDFETTGLLPETDTVIDIGAVHIIDGKEVRRFHTLVNPKRPLAPEIIQLTGITDAQLQTAPTLAEIREELIALIDSKPIMAHNAEFERKFLQHIFAEHHPHYAPPALLDTKDVLALMYPLAPSLGLEHFIRHFGLRDYEHHRGLQDALDMLDVLRCLDGELSKPEFASLCAIVEYWFGGEQEYADDTPTALPQHNWGWTAFFQGRHKNAQLPAYRNFKELFSSAERKKLSEHLSTAPVRLKDPKLFSNVYTNYQLRSAQQQMAEKAARTLNDGGVYVVEAGTGTGKTLAYLTAALSALSSDAETPIVISTHTKALQNQFLEQELPRLQALFDLPDLRAVSLKGMSNYACLRKLNDMLPEDERLFPIGSQSLYAGAFLMRWMEATREGELDELPRPLYDFPLVERAAKETAADYRDCTRQECDFYQHCFYFKKQWESAPAHILAVNHSLLMTYPKSYPQFDRLIVDEADELYAEAVTAFSSIVSHNALQELVRALASEQGVLASVHQTANILARDTRNASKKLDALPSVMNVLNAGLRLQDTLTRLTSIIIPLRGEEHYTLQVTLDDAKISTEQRARILDEMEQLRVTLFEIVQAGDRIIRAATALDSTEETTPAQRELAFRLEEGSTMLKTLATFLEQNTSNAAMYIRADRFDWSFVVTPYNIGEMFAESIVAERYAAVFTSATISNTRDMKDFLRNMGLEALPEGLPVSTSRFKSPFHYRKHSKIVFLKGFPNSNHPQFAERAAEFIASAAQELDGRTLVLFTNKQRMQAVHSLLFPRLQKLSIDLVSHGITNASQHKCVEQFKFSEAAVLMGARGLWKGVDIPGDDLQCLVLEKMPYAVPNPFTRGLQDNLVERYRLEALERGEQPDTQRLAQLAWNEVDKPAMFQAFRQMFGRLIRTETDKGVMFVLDSQLQQGNLSSRHKQLLELLPEVPYTLTAADKALSELDFLLE
jgi:ATP-dependent DNA helicase DinG